MTEMLDDMSLRLLSASALLDSDPPAAARVAGEIIKIDPRNVQARLLLAAVALRVGDAPQAIDLLEGLAGSQRSGSILLDLARAYRAAERRGDCIRALREALAAEPGLAEGWYELSAQLAAAGDLSAADTAYARYAELAPNPWHLSEAARALGEKRIRAAEGMLRDVLKRDPEDAAAMRLLAAAAARREDLIEAERLLRASLEVAPGYSAARYDLALVLLGQQKPTPIMPILDRLLSFSPQNPDYMKLSASVYSLLGQPNRSITLLQRLLAEQGDSAGIWLNMGHELKAAGRSNESIAAYRRSIALAPTGGDAYWGLANLKTFRFDPLDLEAMRAAIKRSEVTPDDRVGLEFSIGKALEDERRFAEAFEHYAAGNSLHREQVSYDSVKTTTHVLRSKEFYTAQFFADREDFGSPATDPIFIVGLPRAGSTLLEQILASHSLVEGTRELADMMSIVRALANKDGQLDPQMLFKTVSDLDAAQVRELADQYLAETRIYRRSGARGSWIRCPITSCTSV